MSLLSKWNKCDALPTPSTTTLSLTQKHQPASLSLTVYTYTIIRQLTKLTLSYFAIVDLPDLTNMNIKATDSMMTKKSIHKPEDTNEFPTYAEEHELAWVCLHSAKTFTPEIVFHRSSILIISNITVICILSGTHKFVRFYNLNRKVHSLGCVQKRIPLLLRKNKTCLFTFILSIH